MAFFRCLRLYFECFKLDKLRGVIACTKYLSGRLPLDHSPAKSSDYSSSLFHANAPRHTVRAQSLCLIFIRIQIDLI